MDFLNNKTQYGECRCCLSKGNHSDLHSEYIRNGQREILADVFMECFSIFLSPNPLVTSQICSVCIKRLQDAQDFRSQVLQNEKILLDALGDDNTGFDNDPLGNDDGEMKYEVKLETDSFNDTDDDIKKEDLIGDCDDDIRSECVELVPGEKELLERFSKVRLLPNRESLVDICPVFFGHLENLKGKIIKAHTISMDEMRKNPLQETIRRPARFRKHKRTRIKHTTFYEPSEKMAHALNATTLLENSNSIVFKSKMRSGFPCFYCREIFNNPKELRNHQTSHPKKLLFKLLTKYSADELIVYADVTDLKCSICNDSIGSMKYLKEHLVNIHEKKMYEVSDRVIPFELGDKESNFDCHVCGVNFETFGAVETHMNSHYRNYICEECGSGFITRHRLKVHTYMLHRVTPITSCEVCKKIFLNRNKYKTHFDTVHRKLKKMQCPKCLEKFVDYFSRQRHLEEKHGVELLLYKCTECDKSFNRKYSLTMHFKRIHAVSRDVQCELCPFMCFTKSELTQHMYKHFGNKSFVCDVCKKAFMRKKSLKLHMRVHSNDTRYSCHLCGETFVQNWSLKTHLKSHVE